MNNEQRQQGTAIAEPLAPEIQKAPTIGVPVQGTGTLTSTGSFDLQSFHGEFAEFHEGYVRHYIALADTKAGFSFGIASAVLAYYLSDQATRTLLISPTNTATFWIAAVSVALLLLSAVNSFLVVAPRLSSPSGEGIVFFRSVAKHIAADRYVADVAHVGLSGILCVRP